jgi:ABC-type branched-subunit amino acid transport system substrate-binding protein
LLLVLFGSVCPPGYAGGETGSAQDGRLFFSRGEKSNGEILTANVGKAAIPVPSTALPCAGCHGRDGLGRPEGGVRPSNITWFNLSREYGGTTEMGRRWQAYDEYRFLRAVSEGIDSAGNPLDSSMPRYNISRREARDLIAYLRVIEDDFDPGVSSDSIVFGSLQPASRSQARLGEAMVEVMRARFDEINRQGGVYGKQLKLEVLSYEDRASFIAESNKMIVGEQVFALLNVYSSTADQSLIDMVEAAGMPSIGPYTQFPAASNGNHLYTFYLHGGLNAQIAVLAKRAAEQAPEVQAFVLYRKDSGFGDIAQDAVALLQENKFAVAQVVTYPGDGSQRLTDLIDLAANPGAVVLFAGSSRDLVSLLRSGPGEQIPPRLFLPGFFVSADILKLPAVYADRLEMAYITVPGDNDGAALAEFRQFMSRNKLEYKYLNARLYAYGATEILLEGIKRAGKRVTRKKLVEAIEQLYAFDAGLNQPVSFSSRRRIGLRGAHVVRLDVRNNRLVSTDTWIRLD